MQDTVRIVLEACQFESGRGGPQQSGKKWFCIGRVVLQVRQVIIIRTFQKFCLQPDEQGHRCKSGRTIHNSFSQFYMLPI